MSAVTSLQRHRAGRSRRLILVVGIVAALAVTVGLTPAAAATAPAAPLPVPEQDPFYHYDGPTPLAEVAPGTPLKSRTVNVHIGGLALPMETTQLLYRSTDSLGKPSVTVTSVIRPLLPGPGEPRLISYQSAYDALISQCQPSYVLAGGQDRGFIATGETLLLFVYLLQGYTVVTSDFEGQQLHWTAGPESGQATLDGIRAASQSPAVGLPADTKVGMIGYSGGAIATEWATELAPHYAPDVNARLVGSAQGGVFVDPAHNLDYVGGSFLWASVIPGALVGLSRAYEIDIDKYASANGKALLDYAQNQCIIGLFGRSPWLTFADLVKPQYADLTKDPELAAVVNKLIMSSGGTPTVPMFIGQGNGGELEGTPGNKPGIGPGDGVMVAGDVRTLARTYCERGVDIDYQEYDGLSHSLAGAPFLLQANQWLADRFDGIAAPNNCTSIKPGNSIAPIPIPGADISPPR